MYNRLNDKNVGDDVSTHATNLSSAPTSRSYDSTPEQDQSVTGFCVPWCGVIFYVMAFFGVFCALYVHQPLSVAIVAMVNQTAVAGNTIVTNVNEDQCPRDPELQHKGGEFIWDRKQQGIALASIYYLYGVTQVFFTINILKADTG